MKKNVYELAMDRISKIFKEFDNIYVSFSGGKDSGVMLNLCLKYMEENNIPGKIGVLHLDYEVQYNETLRYIDRVYQQHQDKMDIYHVCVPFKVTTCTSMYQAYWRPWDEERQNLWVRDMPKNCFKREDFPFYDKDMWDYDFQEIFASWLHRRKNAKRTCCLVGIRTQESYNRWRTIHSANRVNMLHRRKWTCLVAEDIYNAYVIYDWLTTDIWTANGKFEWDYNRIYDLYYQAGVPIEKQRIASPFISAGQESLALYRVLDPDMWGKMICRVNGVNFTGIYGSSLAVASHKKIILPEGFTWETYMHFLLSTLPEQTRLSYLKKLQVSMQFWRERGGCLSQETIEKLENYGIRFQVMPFTNYKTTKFPVRMEYQDDINISEFKELPTFKRMCITILKNDHLCKYMGFSLTKAELENRQRIMDFYQTLNA